ncbi:glutamate synthase subunit beta [Miniimonas arenae]|uniref:Glutamate synthase subunit beta n=1 Tax=Miniimonas arenae TaxID=676201 RepID=A0A5C5BCH7_9MICO|nr:glutamate synthase subunit beta [Miniimonas arenae]TNU75989.1 glutamate synthase subunit beta [Miniimonas arenae]
MADPRGFLKVRQRELPANRPVPVRIMDWQEVHAHRAQTPEESATLNRQSGRCMDCGVPFCHMGCPLGNLIPEWNDLTWRDQWADASDRLHATNNFPEFTGRLCPAPCETACVLGINQEPVTIKNIEVHIAEEAFERGLLEPQPPQWLTGSTVAVIGSGPAGLAVAQQLTRVGHTVAVYERADKIGGLMRYGIPEFKMEKWVIDRRLAQMEAEGTRFYPSTTVGVDITGAELRAQYDAVVVATGSTIPRDLPVPGRQLDGVLQAMEYLVPANRVALGEEVEGQVVATGKHVVVIGGGDTGADCLGTALRQGATSVTQLEIMPRPSDGRPAHQPWPTYPMLYRVSSAHEEGGERRYAVSTTEMVGDDEGRIAALRLVEVALVDGRFTPVEGSEFEIPAQLVLLAMGFVGAETDLLSQLGLDTTPRGSAVRTRDFATAQDGVFVTGDAGRGQSLIVWAIAEGRATAAAVDAYLTGSTALPAPVHAEQLSLQV